MKIAIVGYGTAGQAAAIFLARAGHAIDVLERSTELRAVGAGFLLQPTGLGVLEELGVRDAVMAIGERIERLHGANAAGRMVMDMRYADLAPELFGVGMTRGALFELLHARCADKARIQTGIRIVATRDEGRWLVDHHGDEHGPYDLVVVADGSNSTLRAACAMNRRDPLYPWGAMWCLLPANGWAHEGELRQRYAGTRTMLGVLPVGTRPDHDPAQRWLTFYYSLPGAAVDTFDATALAQLQCKVEALWPELAERTRSLVDPAQLNRARYRDVVMKKPWSGCCVFIGDAAHGMSPQLGQGVNMALLDAQALAKSLGAHVDIETAFVNYARRRKSHIAIYQYLSRWLTPLFQSDHSSLASLRDAFFGPLGRMPIARKQMLRILAGTRRGWLR